MEPKQGMYHLLLAPHPEIMLGIHIGRGMLAAPEAEAQIDLGGSTIAATTTVTVITTPGTPMRATGLGPHVHPHVGITASPSLGPAVDSCIQLPARVSPRPLNGHPAPGQTQQATGLSAAIPRQRRT